MTPATTLIKIPVLQVPDYEILRRIGQGAFGEIWLARTYATGRLRAVKAVYQGNFETKQPYEWEFAGVRKFEEVSREHEGFIDVLHIRRDDEAGYFAYVMEAADDITGAPVHSGEDYQPRTLEAERQRRGRLSPAECVRVCLALTASLGELHRRGLVHRDIKPANIIFVRNAPKLADIGLITEIRPEDTPAAERTLVGTPGYMDPGVHGSAQGDLFSFGRLLGVIATGLPVGQLPEDAHTTQPGSDGVLLRELMAIAAKACDPDRTRRYRVAEEIHRELVALQAGTTLRRLRRVEFWLTCARRYGLLAVAVLLLTGTAGFFWKQKRAQAIELRQQIVGSHIAHGTHAANEGDLLEALSWYAEALRLDHANPRNDPVHRLRLGAVLGLSPTIVQMWFTHHPVNFARFAGQENQVFLANSDHRWAVHDLATGQPLHPSFGTGGEWDTATLASARRLAVTAHRTNYVQTWDSSTGQLLRRLEADSPQTQLFEVAADEEGRWAAACGLAGTNSFVCLWPLSVTNQPTRLLSHPGMVLSVAFDPQGRRLVSSGDSGQLGVWDCDSGRLIRTLVGHSNLVNHAVFSPDGRRIASAGLDWTARLWDAETGAEVIPPLPHGDDVRSVAFSADGTRLITAGLDFTVRIWDTKAGRLLLSLRHNSKPVYAAFSPSGRYVVTSTFDGTVRVWDLQFRWRPEEPAPGICFSGDGSLVAKPGSREVEISRAADGQRVAALHLPNDPDLKCQLNRTGNRLLAAWSSAASPIPQAQLWDTTRGQALGPACAIANPESLQAWSAAGDLVLLETDRSAVVWNLEQGKAWLALTNQPSAAAFDPSGQKLACAHEDQVQVWGLDVQGSHRLAAWKERGPVSSLAWSPDGHRLIAACSDSTFEARSACIRNPLTGALIGAPLNHRDGVISAIFSPDGRQAITCSEDFTAVLWKASSGQQTAPALRHSHQVITAAFSENGRLVATASRDRKVRVWDALTGEPVTPPIPQGDEPRSLQFVGSGRKLAVYFGRRHTAVWTFPSEARPTETLVELATVLSGQQAASGATVVPQSAEALRASWERVRANKGGPP